MVTTIDLLDRLKSKLGSDYRTGKVLNIPQPRISSMRNGTGTFTNEQGMKIAEVLGLHEEFVILSLTAEREKNTNVRKILRTLADKFEPKNFAAGFLIATLAAIETLHPISSTFA